MKTYTISEYAEKTGKTREGIFYQIKKKKVKAKKNKKNIWIIYEEEGSNAGGEEKQKISEIENERLEDLKIKLAVFEEQIKSLKSEIASKDQIIEAKNQTIEAEKRTNIALISTIEQQKFLLNQPKKNFFGKLLFWKK